MIISHRVNEVVLQAFSLECRASKRVYGKLLRMYTVLAVWLRPYTSHRKFYSSRMRNSVFGDRLALWKGHDHEFDRRIK